MLCILTILINRYSPKAFVIFRGFKAVVEHRSNTESGSLFNYSKFLGHHAINVSIVLLGNAFFNHSALHGVPLVDSLVRINSVCNSIFL